jgi:hypothetical protein
MASAALTEAGIVHDLVPIPELPGNMGAAKPKWWIRPTRILVAQEDASEAGSLVEPYQQPRSMNEMESESVQDDSNPIRRVPNWPINRYIWRGPPDAPLVQRVGARLIGSVFVCCGLFLLNEGVKERSLLAGLFATGVLFIGGNVFLKGLAKRNSK